MCRCCSPRTRRTINAFSALEFLIGLQQREPFTFFVDMLGDPGTSSPYVSMNGSRNLQAVEGDYNGDQMKTLKDLIKARGSFIFRTLFLLFAFMGEGTGAQSGQSTLAPGQSPGTFQIKVSQGNLSLEATQAPVLQILQDIGKQAKITVDTNIGPEEKVTIHLDRVPLEEG